MKQSPAGNRELAFAFRQTVPVLLGYLAIGLAFGLILVAAHYPWWLAMVMGLVIYAGAAQYMAVGLFAANAGLAETALLTLLVNARHMVYGVSMLERFKSLGAVKAYLIFALTDETYALLTSLPQDSLLDRKKVYTYISALDQTYWVAGSVLGALAGSFLPIPTTGMGFALSALFTVLLVEQIKARSGPPDPGSDDAAATPSAWRRYSPFLIAALACGLSLIVFGSKQMLLPAIGMAIIGLLALEFSTAKAERKGADS